MTDAADLVLSQPKTAAELEATLLRIFPSWAREPDELLLAHAKAIAAVFELTQAADQTLHDRTFLERADGSWLDEHGRERVKLRGVGESDDDYRVRVRTIDDKLTEPAILAAVNAVLATGTATITQHPIDDPSFVPPAGTTFQSLGIVGRSNAVGFTSLRAYTLSVPDQLVVNRDTAFTAQSGDLNSQTGRRTFTWEQDEAGPAPNSGAYTADQQTAAVSDIYQQIMDLLDDLTAAGVQTRPIVV